MPGEQTATCRSCKAAVVWTVTEKSGRPMPVDAEPVENGNLLLRHTAVGKPPIAHVVDAEERAVLEKQHAKRVEIGMHEDRPFTLFLSHFATCAQGNQWRKGRT